MKRKATCRRLVLVPLALLFIGLILIAILVVEVQDFGGWGTFVRRLLPDGEPLQGEPVEAFQATS